MADMHDNPETPTNGDTDGRTKAAPLKAGTGSRLWSAFWPGLVITCLAAPALPIFGGCAFIQKPEPDPTPTKVPDVKLHSDEYKPTAATVKGTPISDNDPAPGKDLPEYFKVTEVEAGDLLTLQAFRLTAPANTPGSSEYVLPREKPIKVKLAGIISPRPGDPGWAEAATVVRNWLQNRPLQVEQDTKYPLTSDDRKIVQLIIESPKKGGPGTPAPNPPVMELRPFNQLLVRAGYAFMDLTALTSLDIKPWIVDEEYARGVRTEPSPQQVAQTPPGAAATPVPAPAPPVGLWARGIHPAYRNRILIIVQGPVSGIKNTGASEKSGKGAKGATKTGAKATTKVTSKTTVITGVAKPPAPAAGQAPNPFGGGSAQATLPPPATNP